MEYMNTNRNLPSPDQVRLDRSKEIIRLSTNKKTEKYFLTSHTHFVCFYLIVTYINKKKEFSPFFLYVC